MEGAAENECSQLHSKETAGCKVQLSSQDVKCEIEVHVRVYNMVVHQYLLGRQMWNFKSIMNK